MVYSSLINNLKDRNISACYCATLAEATRKVLELIPPEASVGIGNSQTLKKMRIAESLKQRGNRVMDKTMPGLTQASSLPQRRPLRRLQE